MRLLLPTMLLALLLPASAAGLSVHPDGGLRLMGPAPGTLALPAACEGSPAEPTWRVGTAGFHPDSRDPGLVVHPRLARDIHANPPEVFWVVAWEAGDVGLLPANAAVEATLLADVGEGFKKMVGATSPPSLLLDGETTFRFPISTATMRLPAGATLALEAVLRGTDACADGDAGLVLLAGRIVLSAPWDYQVEVHPQHLGGRIHFWATVTSAWGGYDEERLATDLDLEGPSEPEGRAVEGPYGHLQDQRMRDRGERLFSWTWDPGKQGAAPGEYEASVQAYPMGPVWGFPTGEGRAEVTLEPPAEAPSPAVALLVLALALAAVGRGRFGDRTKRPMA